VIALLLGCVFAAVFNSHPKIDHPSQTIGALGLLFSIALFVGATAARAKLAGLARSSAANQRSSPESPTSDP
jgi:hypothetical protein